MPFVKVVKNKAYYKRYQTKYRRRREGKTDYYSRKRLVTQAKNKYNSPKYRLCVRITNADIVCQIIYAKIQGDVVLTAAYSHELPRYGIKVGLTNWAAAYATGLLCARRVLQKLKLDTQYAGVTEADGEFFEVEENDDGPRPFKAFLDTGLRRSTTGHRIFGALKGAADGGVLVPHSESRFPGYNKEKSELDAETLRKYIFGGHISEYMEELQEDDDEAFKRQFARYIANDISAEDVEDMYKDAHAAIRADPAAKPQPKITAERKAEQKKFTQTRRNRKQREERIKQKKAAFLKKLQAGDE
ncbi:60S ribosomal protein L5 [Clydaea vesicula]|uniref:60S ribosomal protein L5 n=1 Tax=Clydaea vesicula TaxID=447962 RepID=A0AAD5Y225_9FUNG|nr:60S ribosomal protein L5 [Clydaea vesicula]KAJ3397045.1 60S ribosomal protein L5 [Lobulomyces angularis]